MKGMADVKPKVVYIKVIRWKCNNPSHLHKTEIIAQACINKSLRVLLSTRNSWTKEKIEEVGKLRDGGMTFRCIGEKFGITGSRVSSIYNRCLRIRRKDAILMSQNTSFPVKL